MRVYLYAAGAVLLGATVFAGCDEEFSAVETPPTPTGGTGGTAAAGGAGGGDEGGQGGQGAVGGQGGEAGAGGMHGECATPEDCESLIGAPPCGAWQCDAGICRADSPGCTDADADGFGAGESCACDGIDCDDSDETFGANGQRDCYSGPGATAGVGICHAGVESCTDGELGPCVGEVVPSAEACNGEDDDCDGVPDEDLPELKCGVGACAATGASCVDGALGTCTPANGTDEGTTCDGIDNDCDGVIDEGCLDCIHVLLNSPAASPDGTPAAPYDSIQDGIEAAADAGKTLVCVSAGADCTARVFDLTSEAEPLTMVDGISVVGSFNSANVNAWTKCNTANDGLSGLSTRIRVATAEGVLFPDEVVSPTMLEGFDIIRANVDLRAGITVDAATGAIISHVKIAADTLVTQVANSYGINLVNGAEATISNVYVTGGLASGQSIAIRSVGSRPTLLDICNSSNLGANGRCTSGCSNWPGLRASEEGHSAGEAYAVLLEDSPGALVQQAFVCGTIGADAAGIKIVGDATGTVVRDSTVNAWGGNTSSFGVLLEGCADAAPWIVNNERIAAEATDAQALVDGVRAVGACHPVIDRNVLILGGMEGGAASPNGVFCGPDSSLAASRCVVSGNETIRGTSNGYPPKVVGVRCDADACARIEHNTLIAGSSPTSGGTEAYGVWLGATGVLVDDNRIESGCGGISIGLRAEDSWARIQNNVIVGSLCNDPNAPALTTSRAMSIIVAANMNEVDVHSNTLLAGGASGLACESSAISLASISAPGAGRGAFRNNILHAGACGTHYGLRELDAGADPARFANNNCDSAPAPTALYLDFDTAALTDVTAVNALTDMLVAGTISVDSAFVAYPGNVHLSTNPASGCIGMGTPVGAPAVDFDGDARDATTPDIGADEAP